jgi:hypothetical protein
MRKLQKIVLSSFAVVLLLAGSAFALDIDIYDPSTVGPLTMLEDFENPISGGWYQSLDTNVGTFYAGGDPGTGDTSYNENNTTPSDEPYFSIQDRAENWYGRYNVTDGGSQWLDSGDITKLTLNINEDLVNAYNSLFFYIMDPSDCSATTTIQGKGTTTASYSFANKSNAAKYLIGITWENNESLTTIEWSTSNTSDGYGLDNFATSPVPEPATMLLLGSSLIGLAGLGRNKFRKR